MTDSLERALGRLEGKVDQILAGQAAHDERLTRADERLTRVERWQSKIAGGIALAAFMIGLVVRALL